MSFYVLMWISTTYTCPWGLGLAPGNIKKLLCDEKQKIEWLLNSNKDVIEKKISELGPSTRTSIGKIQYARSERLSVVWKPKIGGN